MFSVALSDTPEPVSLTPTLVVEDDPAMQMRLRHVLAQLGCASELVTVADSLAGARALLGAHHYGLVMVDIGLPDGSGVDLIGWLQANRPDIPALVISAWRTEEVIFAALRAGAIGYLLKERDDIELGVALRSIEQGGAPIDPSIARRILSWITGQQQARVPEASPLQPSPLDTSAELAVPLTPRERNILELVAKGLSNREMADTLSISRLTVECHTKNIYRKLAVNSRTEAVYEGRRHGLLA